MSQVYRAYHAIRNLSNQKGLPTNAVYGFTNMLRKLINEEKPEYLAVATDLSGPTVRHETYEDYKSTREPMPEDLSEQIPYIWRVCEALRVPVVSFQRYEADDVIGTLARKAVEDDLDVVIVTIDKDMFQLVTDRVTIFDTRNMNRLDVHGIEEKFGVPPDLIVDVLSLMGDASDNIPGAPGIGEKGAKQLIREYGSLENLLAHRHEVSRKTYRESLEQNERLIHQSRELVTIHQDLPLEWHPEDLRLSNPDRKAAFELFSELEFSAILEDFLPGKEATATQYEQVENGKQLETLSGQLVGKVASLSLLFPGDDYLEGTLLGLSVATNAHEAWFLSREVLQRWPQEVALLIRKPRQWIVHDLKPLFFFAQRHAWSLTENFLDTMLMAYLLTPNQNNFSLERLGVEYLQYKLREAGVEKAGLFTDEVVDATCERADITLQLFEVLQPQLGEKQLEKLLSEIEIPLVEVLAGMEQCGVKVDGALLQKMSGEMEQEIEKLTAKIYEIAGTEFNINSPRQLGSLLFDKLDLPLAKKTRKTRHFATGVEVLEELAESYEIARLVLDYRELTKLKNTYLDALPELVNPRTGRIHTSYNQMVAATGRLSSSNPNLQNIPIKSELGRKIRRAFVAEPGYQILAADYSQIELRVMAHLSEDPVLVEAFRQGEDIHERAAREVFGESVLDPHELRRRAKVINFSIMYGVSAFGLAKSLRIGRSEAQQFIDDYFAKYRGVREWIERTVEETRRKGYVSTLFGRIRQIPELHSGNWNVKSFGERTAVNAPIQGTAADLIKKAMVSIHKEMLRRKLQSRLIMQVHDELVFELEHSERDQVETLVKERMEGVTDLIVPLQVDLGIGPSWFEAK